MRTVTCDAAVLDAMVQGGQVVFDWLG